MPNWCFNTIEFKNKDILNDIVKDGKMTYSILIPEPETQENLAERYLSGAVFEDEKWTCDKYVALINGKEWFDWYNWRLDFWGCKWDACHTSPEDFEIKDDGYYHISFDSPWDVPIFFIKALFAKYPDDDIKINSSFEDGGHILIANENGLALTYTIFS